MQILKPILNGLAIVVFIAGGAAAILVNLAAGLIGVVIALELVIMSQLYNGAPKPAQMQYSMNPPMGTPSLANLGKPLAKPVIRQQPQQPNVVLEHTTMPIAIEKPQQYIKPQIIKKEALEAKKLADAALAEAEQQLADKQFDVKPPVSGDPEYTPEPVKSKKVIFKCKKCGKDFPDVKRLKRHVGMAHYQDLEV